MMDFPPVPKSMTALNHFIKMAQDHESRNIVVAYWTLMYAVQHAIKTNPGPKPPELSKLLMALMDWLEKAKAEYHDTEGIANETTAQAMIEEYALKLFNYAEEEERNERYDKKMIKAFYTSTVLMDVLQQFGSVPEDMEEKKKYARWRATYIHNSLKSGLKPIPPNTIIHYTKEDEMRNGFTEMVTDPDSERKDYMYGPPTSDPTDPIPPEFQLLPPPPDNPGVRLNPVIKLPPRPGYPTTSSDTNDVFNLPDVPVEPNPSIPQFPTTPAVVNSPQEPSVPDAPAVSGNSAVGPEQVEKAQKYCKWASSALNYDDVSTAITNLQKALTLLQFGKE